jgi:hypothetical protein
VTEFVFHHPTLTTFYKRGKEALSLSSFAVLLDSYTASWEQTPQCMVINIYREREFPQYYTQLTSHLCSPCSGMAAFIYDWTR